MTTPNAQKENVGEHRSKDHQEQSGRAEVGRDVGQRFAGLQNDGVLA
jgi:hypothetical protein